jgi:ketosteroid isomerase-like protein
MAMTPAEVLRKLIEGVGAQRWDDLAALYAEDAIVEHPLGLPERTRLEGRGAVAQHFATARRMPVRMQGENVVIHPATDPEVAVAEFDYVVENTATGDRFRTANVQVARVRDGLIVNSRDYHDHARIAAAFGRLNEIGAALTT